MEDMLRTNTWVACDDRMRMVAPEAQPAAEKDTPRPQKERKVGIFYFLWHGNPPEAPLIDHSAAYMEGGTKALEAAMCDGPLGYAHYWAEPYFGYYRSDDAWVLRKHAYQLNAAGVDFIFLDVTNAVTYDATYDKLLAVWSEIRREGCKTPDIMFITNTEAARTVEALYAHLYKPNRYPELWFRHEGKPLILIPEEAIPELSQEIRDFFTIRSSWAYTKDASGEWYTRHDGRNCWPWADLYPQKPGLSPDGKPEQMIVMCGFWVNGSYGTNAGRSYHNGHQPDNASEDDYGFSLATTTSGEGLAFAEQFEHALRADPDVLMITGWNEWWAGRWGTIGDTNPANGQRIANTYTVVPGDPLRDNYFVDNFNPEFSRDIEPVKGFYKDNYYYQMVQFIRRYKGFGVTEKVSAAPGAADAVCAPEDATSFSCTGSGLDWGRITPVFYDAKGDTAHRDWPSSGGNRRYVNDSGRNDLVQMQVYADAQYLYFRARCAAPITAPQGTNWMNLFINSDCDYKDGWYGYDYILNRTQSGGKASVEIFCNNAWEFETIGEADLYVQGDVLELRVAKALLRVADVFDFKWADHSVDDGDICKFTDRGDAAPDDRFNYRCRL